VVVKISLILEVGVAVFNTNGMGVLVATSTSNAIKVGVGISNLVSSVAAAGGGVGEAEAYRVHPVNTNAANNKKENINFIFIRMILFFLTFRLFKVYFHIGCINRA
jgi:hypothetical protein